MCGHELVQFGDKLKVPPECEVGFDPLLGRAENALVDPAYLRCYPRFERHVRECGSADECERLPEPGGCSFGGIGRRLAHEPVEGVDVYLTGRDDELVT